MTKCEKFKPVNHMFWLICTSKYLNTTNVKNMHLHLFNLLPVNILPVTKYTYYSNIQVTSKEKQDGTILATELNDLKITSAS